MPGSVPIVKACVTFLTREEGGRATPAIGSETYRPHVVVGDPNRRVAITANNDRTIVEEYLGVRFTGTDNDILTPGRPHDVALELCYFPSVDYTALKTGAEFTIREGGKVVGFGRVIEANHLGAT